MLHKFFVVAVLVDCICDYERAFNCLFSGMLCGLQSSNVRFELRLLQAGVGLGLLDGAVCGVEQFGRGWLGLVDQLGFGRVLGP